MIHIRPPILHPKPQHAQTTMVGHSKVVSPSHTATALSSLTATNAITTSHTSSVTKQIKQIAGKFFLHLKSPPQPPQPRPVKRVRSNSLKQKIKVVAVKPSKSQAKRWPQPVATLTTTAPKSKTKDSKQATTPETDSAGSTLAQARKELERQLRSTHIQEAHNILERRARLGLFDQILPVVAVAVEPNSDMPQSAPAVGGANPYLASNKVSGATAVSTSSSSLLPPPKYVSTSLQPLATEQLMIRHGKIVSPLKNRLAKLNHHRTEFDSKLIKKGEILEFKPQKSRLSYEVQ
ncbi:hypothetical protein H4219_006031 [Mycoemilia scoparia]|uniref:Uncharacterized protein n=1 Tax=Mycoemilia scoparia TaxID=417184 RepID=A0A9W8DIM7_9FUNG|nr:hypothetical protein H4219_006031 [Mycoemilia scoparia]